jgi:hypothetical protein
MSGNPSERSGKPSDSFQTMDDDVFLVGTTEATKNPHGSVSLSIVEEG